MAYDLARGLPIDHPYRWDGRRFVQTKLWQPSDEDIGAALWLDAADEATITTGATFTWADKSDESNDVSQSTAAKQPTTGSRTQNGLNVLDFDNATAQMLRKTSPSNLPTADYDVFFMAKIDVVDVNRWLLTVQETGGGQIRINRWSDWSNELLTSTGTSTATDTGGDTNPHVANFRWDGANIEVLIDGATTAGPTARDGVIATWNEYINVCSNAFTGSTFDGIVGEVIMCDNLSLALRQKVEGYLAWKWGLEGNLPGGHPYENAPPLY